MKVSFRVGRYLLALLWHWSLPFTFGGVFASVLAIQGVQQGVELLDKALDASISRVAQSCSAAALNEPTSLINPLLTAGASVVRPSQWWVPKVESEDTRGSKGASPFSVVRDECHGDGASSCASLSSFRGWGSGLPRGGTPTKRRT